MHAALKHLPVRNGRRDQATRSRAAIEAAAKDARHSILNAAKLALLRSHGAVEGKRPRLTLKERREHIGQALVWVQTAENDLRSLRVALERESERLEGGFYG